MNRRSLLLAGVGVTAMAPFAAKPGHAMIAESDTFGDTHIELKPLTWEVVAEAKEANTYACKPISITQWSRVLV